MNTGDVCSPLSAHPHCTTISWARRSEKQETCNPGMTCSGCARAGGGWSGRAPRRQRRARGPARRDPLGSERRGWPGAGLAGAAGELGLGREHAASRRQRAPGAAVRCAVAARAGAERRGGERERRRPLPRIPGRAGGRARGGERRRGQVGRGRRGHRAGAPAPGQRGSRHAGSASAPR